MIVAEENGIAIKSPFLCVFKDFLLGIFGLFLKIQGQTAVNEDSGILRSKFHAVPTDLVGATVNNELYIVLITFHLLSLNRFV
jgi:hypothetical protein